MISRRALLAAGVAAAAGGPWIARARQAAPRVVVVGAGFGGATFAKFLHALAPQAEILLIDRRAAFLTGPFTNLAVTGLRPPSSLRRRLDRIGQALGLRVLCDEVTAIDPVTRRLHTAGHGALRADRIVLAPGVAMRWDRIAGLDDRRSRAMPHAWLGDAQVDDLRRRFDAVPDGGLILIGSPVMPYPCPLGPYERAALMAARLRATGRRRTRILIADAKDDFSESATLRLEWDRFYPGVIDWRRRADGGEVRRVDVDTGEVWLGQADGRPLKPDLASVVPAMQAAALARQADLADASGWCPVDAARFESTRHAGVHVLGDAAALAPIPKSAFAANSQAKLLAVTLAAEFAGRAPPRPAVLSTCYSLLDADAAISVSGYYGVVADQWATLSAGGSPLRGEPALRAREARAAYAWYDHLTLDSFGHA